MKTQSDVKDYLCDLVDNPIVDPIGFKREALLEYADSKTVTYLRRTRLAKKPKKGKRLLGTNVDVADWIPVGLTEEAVKRNLKLAFDRAWLQLKRQNDRDKGVAMYRILDKIEIALWLLDDQEAIDFIREPDKYEHSAVLLMTWLSNRYEHVPRQ